jgi:hypothetical protein
MTSSTSRALASETWAVPTTRTLPCSGGGSEAALVAHRYARLAAATNASVAAPLATEDTAAANARVAEALGARMATDLRSRYDHPGQAVEAVSVSSVRIVVRTWGSPSEAG